MNLKLNLFIEHCYQTKLKKWICHLKVLLPFRLLTDFDLVDTPDLPLSFLKVACFVSFSWVLWNGLNLRDVCVLKPGWRAACREPLLFELFIWYECSWRVLLLALASFMTVEEEDLFCLETFLWRSCMKTCWRLNCFGSFNKELLVGPSTHWVLPRPLALWSSLPCRPRDFLDYYFWVRRPSRDANGWAAYAW